MAKFKGTRVAIHYLDTTATPNEYKPWDGSVTSTQPLTLANAIDVTGWTISSNNYSGTTNITNDYKLSRIEFNFSAILSKNITITTSDGTQLWFSDSDLALNIAIDGEDVGFSANENITITVDRNASSPVCLMDVILVVET